MYISLNSRILYFFLPPDTQSKSQSIEGSAPVPFSEQIQDRGTVVFVGSS